ncbi:MAG: substrate-binding domain-containing protein [Acidobacteriota bacterium]
MQRILLLLALVAATVFGVSEIRGQDADFVVIVHVDNPTESIEPRTLSKMFLKKVKRWPDDTPVVVLDQDDDNEVRSAFSRAIHKKSVSAIKSYWQRLLFSGRAVPPDELPSDADVIARVAAEVGAVGYVSPDAELGEGVKILPVSEK